MAEFCAQSPVPAGGVPPVLWAVHSLPPGCSLLWAPELEACPTATAYAACGLFYILFILLPYLTWTHLHSSYILFNSYTVFQFMSKPQYVLIPHERWLYPFFVQRCNQYSFTWFLMYMCKRFSNVQKWNCWVIGFMHDCQTVPWNGSTNTPPLATCKTSFCFSYPHQYLSSLFFFPKHFGCIWLNALDFLLYIYTSSLLGNKLCEGQILA